MARSRSSKQMKTISLITAVSLLASSFSFAGGEGWTSDFAAAKAQAAKEGKDLLIDFTGSDWCGWCIKLNEEVFQHDPFKKGVADKFVLVELDYPRDKSKLDEKTIKQNDELKSTYEPRGFPTILLTDASGKPYAQTGYQKGGPEAYVKHLDELRAKKTDLKKSFEAADKLEGVAKAKALVEALGTLQPQHHKHYSDTIEAIEKADPKDESGFVKEQKFRAAKSDLEKQLSTAMRAQKLDDAIKAVDSFIAKHNPEGAEKQEILANKVNIYMSQQKLDEAEKALDEIIAVDAKSQMGTSAAGFKPRLAEMKKKAAEKNTEEAADKPAEKSE